MKASIYSTGSQTENGQYLTRTATAVLREDSEGVEREVLNIYPEIRAESFEGFGGAITEAAAYVYSLMDEGQRQALLRSYFAENEMNYRMVRIPIDSCDFGLGTYEADADPEDVELAGFSLERIERYILPMLQDAERMAGHPLEIMLSPWSPPAYMKTNGDRQHGGALRTEYYERWATYLCHYIRAFRDRGFRVRRMTLQNEPKAAQTWDSCVYTAKEERAFLQVMHAALERHGLQDVEIYIWDHNKERLYERVAAIVDDETRGMVAGAACHWYSGDHFENLDLVRQQYPDLRIIISESCIEFSRYASGDDVSNALRLSHELCGDLAHGVTAFYDWNLLLDEEGGPNYVGNYCLAPFLYDRTEHRLMPQLIQRHYWHYAHFIQPGARRLGTSRYTADIDAVAYRNPDGNIVVVLLNTAKQDLPVVLRLEERILEMTLEAQSIHTCVIERA